MKVNFVRATAALALVAGLSVPALAANIAFSSALNGANVVPVSASTGTATFTATYGTVSKRLVGTVTYTGLSGDATAISFHTGLNTQVLPNGVIMPKEVTGPEILSVPGGPSPVRFTVVLTAEQAAAFEKGGSPPPATNPGIAITSTRGLYIPVYLEVQTAANPAGEIRGQVTVPQ